MSGDDDEEDGGESAEDGQPAKAIRSPHEPAKEAVDEHEFTHVAFRSWCVHCLNDKARNSPHKASTHKEEDKESTATTVSMDYTYIAEKSSDAKESATNSYGYMRSKIQVHHGALGESRGRWRRMAC